MGLFNQFPFTNFHEMNLDWIIKAIKENSDIMKDVEKNIENLNKNMEAVVNNKIDELINDGYFNNLLTELTKQKPYIVNNYNSIATIKPALNEYIIMSASNGAIGIYKADNVNKTGSIKCSNGIYVNVVAGNGYADIFGADPTGNKLSENAINNAYSFFGFVVLNGTYSVHNTVKANVIIGNNSTINRRNWISGAAMLNVFSDTNVFMKDFNIKIDDAIPGSIVRTQNNNKIYIDNVNIYRTGDIINSEGAWAFTLSCDTFTIKNCYIDTLSSGETGDGIHIVKAKYGVIDSCYVSAGDDAIALFTQNISTPGNIDNIFINNCVISSPQFSGIKLGTKVSYRVKNCFVSNCRFVNCKTYIVSTQDVDAEHSIYLYNCSSEEEGSEISAIQANNHGLNLYIDGGNYKYKKLTQLNLKNISVKNAILNGNNFSASLTQTTDDYITIKDCDITGIISSNDGCRFIVMNNIIRNTTNFIYRSSEDTTKTTIFANLIINSTFTANGTNNNKINNLILNI